MPQAITQSYDFRKTYFRNFYDNRKQGMIKGAKYGRLARLHSKKVADDTIHDGTVWNKDLGVWQQSTAADYAGAVNLLDVFRNGTVDRNGNVKSPRVEEDKYYIALNQDLIDSVNWMHEKELHLVHPYDLCTYRVSTLLQFNATPKNLDQNGINHFALTEVSFKTEFVKMTKKTGDRTMKSFSYKMEQKQAPLQATDTAIGKDVPLYSPGDGKCIFYPNTNVVVPDVGMTSDPITWDLSGETSIIGRQQSGKYTCDKIDITDNNIISGYHYEIPMKYKGQDSAVLPSPSDIETIPDFMKNVISLIMYKRRNELKNSIFHVGTKIPVFSGIYVAPVASIYMEILEMRDKSNKLVSG